MDEVAELEVPTQENAHAAELPVRTGQISGMDAVRFFGTDNTGQCGRPRAPLVPGRGRAASGDRGTPRARRSRRVAGRTPGGVRSRASIPGMSKMLWLAFGAAFAVLLCLYYFGGAWTGVLAAVVVVVFLGWKYVAPRFGLAIDHTEAERKREEKEAIAKSAFRE